MKKQILVDIYLANNLGDDMFLDYLAKKYTDYDFIPFHPGKNYESFFKQYSNIKQFPYGVIDRIKRRIGFDKLKNYADLANKYDGLLFLGGGIFREESYWKDLYDYRLNIVSQFKKIQKPVWFMGCNFGPFHTDEFREEYSKVFALVDQINFRDLKSYQLFKNLDNTAIYPDILWDYSLPISEKERDVLGISVINPKHKMNYDKYCDEYIQSHIQIIKNHLAKGFKIKLFSFCDTEGDLEICQLLSSSFGEVEVLNYSGNIQQYLMEIGKCSLFIGARFHANVIAIKYNIPLIPVIYGDKTENLLDDLNYNGQKIFLNNINEITTREFEIFNPDVIKNIILESKSNLNIKF